MSQELLHYGLLLPAGVAGVLGGLLAVFFKPKEPKSQDWGGLAVCAGFLSSFYFLEGLPLWPEEEGWKWMFWGVALLAILQLFVPYRDQLRGLWTAMLALLGTALVYMILKPLDVVSMTSTQVRVISVGLGAGSALIWVFLRGSAHAKGLHDRSLAPALTLHACGLTALLLFAGSERLAALAGAMAAACGALMVISWIGLERQWMGGVGAAATLLTAGLGASALYYLEGVHVLQLALVGVPPLFFAWYARPGSTLVDAPVRGALWAVLAVLFPVGTAVAWAFLGGTRAFAPW